MKIERLFMLAALLFLVYTLFLKPEKFTMEDTKNNVQNAINNAYNAYVFGIRSLTP